jgi:hypothetical protein
MKKLIFNRLTLIVLSIGCSSSAISEVLESNEHGFTIEIERVVPVKPYIAYQQFLKVADWWNHDHTYFGKSENLTIDATAGGCFCEIDGNKQVLHMTVSFVDPNREIRMIGGLGPLQMMGAYGGMSWKFIPIEDNSTKIIHRYQVSGTVKGGLIPIAPVVDRVQTIQVEGLVNQLKK